NVAATVRIISGRMRKYSMPAGKRLASTSHLHLPVGRVSHMLDLERMRGPQDTRVLGGNRRQKTLREGPHPDHQHQQRYNRDPLARCEVVQMMAHGFRSLSIK